MNDKCKHEWDELDQSDYKSMFGCDNCGLDIRDYIIQLEKQNKIMREALEIYANKSNYRYCVCGEPEHTGFYSILDGWYRAKAALEECIKHNTKED